MATIDYKIAGNLPTNIEAERAILGAILLDNSAFNEAAAAPEGWRLFARFPPPDLRANGGSS